MPDKKLKKITTVHEHPRRIYDSKDAAEMKKIFSSYKKDGVPYPTSGRLNEYENSDKYDELIAIWCDYFNKVFPPTPPQAPLDPNVVKALICSESDFEIDPKNSKAFGITQITPETLKILLDPGGEAKNFVFKDIRQKDLKDPEIAIPMATRWLFRKRVTAEHNLGRQPTAEELILEYKGLLNSNSKYRDNALSKFRKAYEALTKK
jgi:hypothetical protein